MTATSIDRRDPVDRWWVGDRRFAPTARLDLPDRTRAMPVVAEIGSRSPLLRGRGAPAAGGARHAIRLSRTDRKRLQRILG